MLSHQPRPRAFIATIDPSFARELLDAMEPNRPIRRGNLRKLEHALRNDEWVLNGESVIIDTNKRLIDGQHRCQAVVNTGVSITTIVAVVPSDERTFASIDQGAGRSASDALSVDGYKNTRALASVVRIVTLWEMGALGNPSGLTMTSQEVVDRANNDDAIVAAATLAKKNHKHIKFLRQNVLGLAYYLCSEPFMERFVSGANLAEGSPVLALRRALESAYMARKGRNTVDIKWQAALVLKAYKAFLEGKEMKKIRFGSKEKFPNGFSEEASKDR